MAPSTSFPPVQTVVKPISNKRRFIGAKSESEGTIFRVWAPNAKQVDVIVEGKGIAIPLVQKVTATFLQRIPTFGPATATNTALMEENHFPILCHVINRTGHTAPRK